MNLHISRCCGLRQCREPESSFVFTADNMKARRCYSAGCLMGVSLRNIYCVK